MSAITVVRGTNDKPAASQVLIDAFTAMDGVEGQLFTGYPIISAADGRHPIDAVFVSPQQGVVVFDLVEGRNLDGYPDRQDESATRLQQRLLGHRDLVSKRRLLVEITPVSFAPAVQVLPDAAENYRLANAATLAEVIGGVQWDNASTELYERTLSAIQNISTVRQARTPRHISSPQSRGAKLGHLEDSIATLDMLQSKAVIETVDGVQRIRGLAGSGKTIVLALKAGGTAIFDATASMRLRLLWA
jgi:superfamily I DNA and RNA helicase